MTTKTRDLQGRARRPLKPKFMGGRLVGFSASKERPVSARPAKEFKTDDYPSRVAANLRLMREEKGWTIADLQDRLATQGEDVPASSLYAYERGKLNGGVNLPWELVPVIGRIFGHKPPAGWLPPK